MKRQLAMIFFAPKGASCRGTFLRGALLNGALLRGALLGGAVLSGALLLPSVALAQAVPDAGTIMRDIEQLRRPDAPVLSPQAVPEAPVKPDPDALTFVVKRFELTGVTLVPIVQVQAALEPWLDRPITFEDLERGLNAISELYQKDGWYVRPQLPAQDIVDGTVIINVIEGKLGQVDPGISADMPLSADRVRRFIKARQLPGEPLNMDELSRAITILNEQPGVSAQAALAPSLDPGASDVIVETVRLPSVSGSLQADNWGARSTGYYRVTGSANWNNPFGIGDQLQANVLGSEGTVYGRLGYSLPVGYDGWRLGLSASALYYKLIGEFASLDSRGTAETLAASATYPLVRQPLRNTTLSITGSDSHYNNRNLTDKNNKRVSLAALGLTGDEADNLLGGGFSVYGLTLTSGYAKLGDKTLDQLGPNTYGTFFTLAGNGGRLQRLTNTTSLWFSFSGQMANRNLDSSQRFSLGGPQGVRAYPVNEGTGDQGLLASLEARYDFYPGAQASLFYDFGWIQQFKSMAHLSPDARLVTGPNEYNLQGWGAAISYNYNNRLSMKFTVASRIGKNPAANFLTGADGDGTNDQTRFWFNVVLAL